MKDLITMIQPRLIELIGVLLTMIIGWCNFQFDGHVAGSTSTRCH